MKTLLKGGRVLDPSQNLDVIGDLLIENDQIVEMNGQEKLEPGDTIIDCTGLWVCPGLIDLHVHLREPGFEYKETISTGTQAAAAGGFTTICCMPNTDPPLDKRAIIEYVVTRAASSESGGIFVAPIGAVARGMGSDHLAEIASMKEAGIVAVSDDAFPIQDAEMMHQAMQYCKMLDLPIATHCEDLSLTRGGAMNEGAMSAVLGLKGMPRTAEDIQVARNCVLSISTGCRLHVCHVSTWGAVETIRKAKSLGAPVTAEVTPHHLILTDNATDGFDTNCKMNPPLRTQKDVDALREALADGTIDCIATDHAPHSLHEKQLPFSEAPFGIVGLESAVGLILTHLTHTGVLSPLQTIRAMSTAPAEAFALGGGTLIPGELPAAQITVIDPDLEWTFDVRKTFSKSRNSPFHGWQLRGKAVMTIWGDEVYRDGVMDARVSTQ
ncbi:MAG: dihydroorotase [Fimbriimonadia bacterium]|jgi:dihydroorotase